MFTLSTIYYLIEIITLKNYTMEEYTQDDFDVS